MMTEDEDIEVIAQTIAKRALTGERQDWREAGYSTVLAAALAMIGDGWSPRVRARAAKIVANSLAAGPLPEVRQ